MSRVLRIIGEMKQRGIEAPAIIAIDGRCASGKTTLADELANEIDVNVVHMDDFYLPFEQRTPSRMSEPGGHMDVERLLREVIEPLNKGKTCSYRPYVCHQDTYKEPVEVRAERVTIIEGSYSCHPKLRELYALRIFLTVTPKEQYQRLIKRDITTIEDFQQKWIPREELYFWEYKISQHSHLTFS